MEYIKLREVISSAKTERCRASDYPVLSITKSDGVVLQSDKFKKRIASTDTEQYKLVKRGQLVQGIHIDEANFGIQSIVDIGIVSPAYKIWNVDFQKIVPKYLETVLRSPRSVRYYSSKFNGSVKRRERIADNDFLAMEIPFPSKEQQQYAVDVLEKASNMTTLYQQQLQKLDELVKARFVELFGDPNDNPKGYSKKQLKDTCRVITGNTPSRAVSEYYGEHIEWIKTDNIVSGLLNPTTATESLSEKGMAVSRTVESGAILMVCIAGSIASIGRVCVTDRKVSFNQQINAIVPSDYNTLFLYVMLQISKEYLVDEINMALKGILSKSKLEEKTFYVPPIELQEQFAAFVEQTDESKAVIQKALDETQLLFDSLMQEYFG